MTVLLHWSASWLVTFPQPPVPVLVMLEAMLRRHDSALAKHLRSCSADALIYGAFNQGAAAALLQCVSVHTAVGRRAALRGTGLALSMLLLPGTNCWSLLRSLFTEVLSSSDWLRLWDHLFTASNDLFLLNAAAVAYTIANRNSLLAAKTRADVETFFHHQQVRAPTVTAMNLTAVIPAV
eukprot:2052-Heterococcus_DN1.PRE.1